MPYPSILPIVFFIAGSLASCSHAFAAQPESASEPDTVWVQPTDDKPAQKRRGRIVAWEGNSLTLSSHGRERQISNDQIIRFETDWPDQAAVGRSRLHSGQYLAAVEPLSQAVSVETRTWAKNVLRADLVQCHVLLSQVQPAVDLYLRLIQSDPQTRFLNLAPLAWTGSTAGADLAGRTNALIESANPLEQLIGASWMVGGPQQDRAIEILESVANDIDANIAALARAQLWRTRVRANPKQIELWVQQVREMPKLLQAGPWFVVASHHRDTGNEDDAIITWMRLPILYPERPDLCAAALYEAARLLHNSGNDESSGRLLAELQQKYGDSTWALLARQISVNP